MHRAPIPVTTASTHREADVRLQYRRHYQSNRCRNVPVTETRLSLSLSGVTWAPLFGVTPSTDPVMGGRTDERTDAISVKANLPGKASQNCPKLAGVTCVARRI